MTDEEEEFEQDEKTREMLFELSGKVSNITNQFLRYSKSFCEKLGEIFYGDTQFVEYNFEGTPIKFQYRDESIIDTLIAEDLIWIKTEVSPTDQRLIHMVIAEVFYNYTNYYTMYIASDFREFYGYFDSLDYFKQILEDINNDLINLQQDQGFTMEFELHDKISDPQFIYEICKLGSDGLSLFLGWLDVNANISVFVKC